MEIEIQLIEHVEGKDFGLRIVDASEQKEVAMLTVGDKCGRKVLEGIPRGNYKTRFCGLKHAIYHDGREMHYPDEISAASEAEMYARLIAEKYFRNNKTGGILIWKN